jgi:hypothetical protein
MQQCQDRVFPQFVVPSFDPNEWCLKNGLHSGGLNPGPLGHESSALTTRPRLLPKVLKITSFFLNAEFKLKRYPRCYKDLANLNLGNVL